MKSPLGIIVVSVALILVSPISRAAIYQWTGNGTTDNWAESSNWNTTPIFNSTQTIYIPTGSQLAMNLGGARTIGTLQLGNLFNSSFNGGALTIATGDITASGISGGSFQNLMTLGTTGSAALSADWAITASSFIESFNLLGGLTQGTGRTVSLIVSGTNQIRVDGKFNLDGTVEIKTGSNLAWNDTETGSTHRIGSTLQGALIKLNGGTYKHLGSTSFLNNIEVTTLGGTLENTTSATMAGSVALSGALNLSLGAGIIGGTVTLDQSAVKTLTIKSTGGGTISGAIVDGTGTTGNGLHFSGSSDLVLKGNNTYSGGTSIDGPGWLIVSSGSTLGTGAVAAATGARVDLVNPLTAVAAGSKIQTSAGSVIILRQDSSLENRLSSTSAGVLALNSIWNGDLDLSAYGSGSMILGTTTGGAINGKIIAGLDGTVRLGGGQSDTIQQNGGNISIPGGAPLLQGMLTVQGLNNLTGSVRLEIGSPADSKIFNQEWTAGWVAIENNQNYSGGTYINTGKDTHNNIGLISFVDGGTPFGSGPVESHGMIGVSGTTGSFVGLESQITLGAGSELLLDNNNLTNDSSSNGRYTGTSGQGRWGDDVDVRLNNAMLNVTTASSGLVEENVGNIRTEGGSRVLLSKRGDINSEINLNAKSIIRENRGTLGLILSNGFYGATRFRLDTAPEVTNGIVAPYIVMWGNGGAYFATYDVNGFGKYQGATVTDINTATATSIVEVNNSVLSTDREIYALHFTPGPQLQISGNYRLTVTSGGIILGSNSKIKTTELNFGSAEGLIFVSQASVGSITSSILGSNGLTVFGAGTSVQDLSYSYGTLEISGNNNFSGQVTINDARLRITGGNGIPNGSDVHVSDQGELDLGTGPDQNVGKISGAGSIQLQNHSLTVNVATGETADFSGTIQGTGNVIKAGTGKQILSGISTYTGQTIVQAGTLVINGSIASSSGTIIDEGASLSGNASLGHVGGSGTLSPGNSPGLMTVTEIDPSAGLDFVFEFTQLEPSFSESLFTGNDVLRITGSTPFLSALNSSNQITLDFTGASLADGQIYYGGFFTDETSDFLSLIQNAQIVYQGLTGYTVTIGSTTYTMNLEEGPVEGRATTYQVAAVPEPAAAAFVFLGLVFLAAIEIRKRRQKVSGFN